MGTARRHGATDAPWLSVIVSFAATLAGQNVASSCPLRFASWLNDGLKTARLLPSQSLLRKHVPKVMQASMGAGRCIWESLNALCAQLKILVILLLVPQLDSKHASATTQISAVEIPP